MMHGFVSIALAHAFRSVFALLREVTHDMDENIFALA